MAVFPLQVFTENEALVGFDGDYRSSLVGQKYAGQPKGVYVGFTPVVTGASTLTFVQDPLLGYSLLKVTSDASRDLHLFWTLPDNLVLIFR
jgi:hypothetical protein